MISKAIIKRLRSLQFKKTRDELGLFPVEGPKMVHELLKNKTWEVMELYATAEWIHSSPEAPHFAVEISMSELNQISGLQHPNSVFAVAKMRAPDPAQLPPEKGFFLLLDQIQDPGNLGTIIRIADWFGVNGVICSMDCADCYNPKVIQASMGSLFRLIPLYVELGELLKQNKLTGRLVVYSTHLKGESLFDAPLEKNAMVIFGNESRGVNPDLTPFISKSLLIPSKANLEEKAESLNVAIAAGIVCSEWSRRK